MKLIAGVFGIAIVLIVIWIVLWMVATREAVKQRSSQAVSWEFGQTDA